MRTPCLPSPRLLLAAAALCAFLGPTPARAAGDGDLQRYLLAAKRLYQNADNEQALEQIQRAKPLSRGLDDDVVLAFYEGVILADLGRRDESSAAFRTALLLKPDAQLPVRVSPKVRAHVEWLRGQIKQELARIPSSPESAEAAAKPAGPTEAATAAAAPAPAPAAPSPAAKAAPDPAPALTGAPSAAVALPVASATSEPRRIKWTPITLTAATALAAGAGVLMGELARQDYRKAEAATYQSERIRASKSTDQKALAANVLFIAAGALGVGAVVTWVF